MRRILTALMEARRLQLQRMSMATALREKRDADVVQLFNYLERNLGGLSFNANGGFDAPEGMMQEAMVSGDFTFAIQEFVQRLMHGPYQERTFDFEQFLFLDTVPNFLPVTRYQRRGGVDDLLYVGEDGGSHAGYVPDATKRQYQAYVWERDYGFPYQLLVNDDMGYFNDTAEAMGRSARRTLEKYVSRMLTNATSIARLTGLGANYSTTGRLTTSRISTARMAFAQRTDSRSNPISASLRYIVHHTGLIDTVSTIQQSTLVPENNTNAANVVRNNWVGVEDPHMSGTAPDLPWYALVDHRASGIRPLVLARRNGVPAPLLLRKRSDIEAVTSLLGPGTPPPPMMGDFLTGAITIKVHDEWGTYIDATNGNWYDEKGGYYSSGTAA